MAGAKACVFCGCVDRKITGEHIFAAWVDKCFPEAAAVRGTSFITARNGARKEYQSLPFEQKVRVVCDDCNNGWMSALEIAVAPVLGPMVVSGQWTRLTPAIQRTLATWATKTAFILQYLHPAERTIPDSEYRQFHRAQGPVARSIVFLAHRASMVDHTGMPLIVTASHQEIDIVAYDETVTKDDVFDAVAKGSRVYRVTFGIGHVVFVIFGHTFPKSMNLQVSPDLARIIRCCWPIQRRTAWPPPDPVEQMGGLIALHKAFEFPG
jgi:hypothetical protein